MTAADLSSIVSFLAGCLCAGSFALAASMRF